MSSCVMLPRHLQVHAARRAPHTADILRGAEGCEATEGGREGREGKEGGMGKDKKYDTTTLSCQNPAEDRLPHGPIQSLLSTNMFNSVVTRFHVFLSPRANPFILSDFL